MYRAKEYRCRKAFKKDPRANTSRNGREFYWCVYRERRVSDGVSSVAPLVYILPEGSQERLHSLSITNFRPQEPQERHHTDFEPRTPATAHSTSYHRGLRSIVFPTRCNRSCTFRFVSFLEHPHPQLLLNCATFA